MDENTFLEKKDIKIFDKDLTKIKVFFNSTDV